MTRSHPCHPPPTTGRPAPALSLAALLCLMLISRFAEADKFEIEMGLTTHHWVTEGLYENNQLVGAGFKNWELGTFVNSFGDRSYSAGYRWRLSRSFSLSTGVMHGYGDNAKWFPFRVNDEVIYVVFNAEPPVDGPLSLRLRVMGEATLVSVVVRPLPGKKATIKPAEPMGPLPSRQLTQTTP